MTRRTVLVLAIMAAIAYADLRFGQDLHAYARLYNAVEDVAVCETDGDCDEAWTRLDAVRGVSR